MESRHLWGKRAQVYFRGRAATYILLLCSPGEDWGNLPDLDLPWAALEAMVRDWGFTGSPGRGNPPVLGTWI